MPFLEVSPGELVDRMTILELKLRHVPMNRLAPVREAYGAVLEGVRALQQAIQTDSTRTEVQRHVEELRATNGRLWALEDRVRKLLAARDTGPEFVEVAAAVPALNDRRAAAKRAIDELLGQDALAEIKHYSVS